MKKGVSFLVALTLTLTSAITVRADDLKDAQKDLKEVQSSISEKKDQLEDISKKHEETKKSADQLDKKVSEAEETLSSLNKKLKNLNKQISDYEKKIEDTKKALEEQDELFKKRVRALYVNGNESYLEIILSSSSFSDFFSRLESVTRVMEYDKKLIESMENNKKELEAQKTKLDKAKKENAALKSQADKQYKELEKNLADKQSLVKSLEQDKASYEKMITEEEQESKAIASLIATIKKKKEEEAKRKAEEAKRKSEEAKKKAQEEANRGSSGSANKPENNSPNYTESSELGKLYRVTDRVYGITSKYGPRVHPIFGVQKPHSGMDIGAPYGSPIYALADGEVIFSGSQGGYGNVVMIDHGSIISVYAHASKLIARAGQTVKGGQLIAQVGSTGNSTGPHLHFEIRKPSGSTINPDSYYVR